MQDHNANSSFFFSSLLHFCIYFSLFFPPYSFSFLIHNFLSQGLPFFVPFFIFFSHSFSYIFLTFIFCCLPFYFNLFLSRFSLSFFIHPCTPCFVISWSLSLLLLFLVSSFISLSLPFFLLLFHLPFILFLISSFLVFYFFIFSLVFLFP